MKELDQLIEITERLLGPGGCPWDQEQTLKTLRPCIIEEACEILEAIDLDDKPLIQEELGDLFFVAMFLCMVAEKEKQCTWAEILKELNEKLIRRHPHVFGEAKAENSDAVLRQWSEIKKGEKNKIHRKSALDSIPKDLSGLSRAQKVYKKMQKTHFVKEQENISKFSFENEEQLGNLLLAMVIQAQEQGLDAENALREVLANTERSFRQFENKSTL